MSFQVPVSPILQPFWQRVRARAGLKDVRIHDLRHTFASTAVAAGQGLHMIGKLLGHTQVQTTARYAHLAAEPVKIGGERRVGDFGGCAGGVSGAIPETAPTRICFPSEPPFN